MKVSILCPMPYLSDAAIPFRWPVPGESWDPADGRASMLAGLDVQIRADQLGFDWVSVAEHHYSPNQLSPNPLLLAAALSQRLEHATVALMGPTLPLLNPVRVAEEVAMLDNLTGGRLVAGFLRGTPNEFLTYGTNPEETRARFDEAMELILHAWTEPQPFAWQGRFFRFRTVSIWPRPVQQPRPPVYIGGRTPQSATFAARHRLGIAMSFIRFEEVRDSAAYYRQQAEAQGWTAGDDQVVYRGFCYVGETDEAAEAESAAHGFGHLGPPPGGGHGPGPGGPGGPGGPPGGLPPLPIGFDDAPGAPSLGPAPGATALADPPLWAGTFFCGSPDTVYEQIRFLHQQGGVGVVDLIFNGHGLPQDLALRSLDRFGTEVLPRLQAL